MGTKNNVGKILRSYTLSCGAKLWSHFANAISSVAVVPPAIATVCKHPSVIYTVRNPGQYSNQISKTVFNCRFLCHMSACFCVSLEIRCYKYPVILHSPMERFQRMVLSFPLLSPSTSSQRCRFVFLIPALECARSTQVWTIGAVVYFLTGMRARQ